MADEVTFAQNIIRCALCEQAGDYHCKPCQLNLCCECISNHLSDKTKKHEVVELVSQQKHYNSADMPECSNHESYICDMFCKDCNIPICIKCLTSYHRQHNFISLEEFLNEKKKTMLNEIQEIESKVLPEFQKHETGVDDDDYEKTIENIFAHEDLICNIVREAGSKLRDQVVQHKTNNLEIIEKNASVEKSILNVIHDTWLCLVRNDPKEIFELRRLKFQMNAKCSEVNWHMPYFQVQTRQGWEISSLFGTLLFEKEQVLFLLFFKYSKLRVKIYNMCIEIVVYGQVLTSFIRPFFNYDTLNYIDIIYVLHYFVYLSLGCHHKG